MPENACLHIQARDADPVRVVTLPGLSVRIGRASYCEVRLPEPEVAEEECHLKRRGLIWHLVPLGRSGAVRIDDHPVEQPQPLPYGVPFRVGDHRLILQSSGESTNGWGSFERPISLDVNAPSVPRPEWREEPGAPEQAVEHSPEASTGPEAEEERLKRWKARQEQRASWLQTRQEERRWEERWKAAGERLRSRASAIPATPTASEPIPTRRPESPPATPRARRPDVRHRPFPTTSEPALPPPSISRETAPTVAPIPEIHPLAAVPPSLPVRSSLAPSGWGKTPISKRREPKIAPIAPTLPPSSSTARQEPASPPPFEPTAAIPEPDPQAHGYGSLPVGWALPTMPQGSVGIAHPTGTEDRDPSDVHPDPTSEGARESEGIEPQEVRSTDLEQPLPAGPEVVREEECGLAREFRPTEKEGLQPLPATADLGEGGTESNSQVAPPWRDDLAVLEPPVPAPEASPEVAAARPEAEDLWEAIWLEASINYEVRELHQGGPFVADTNLGMGRAEKWAGTIRFDTATATTNQDHAGVFPRVRSASGRSRRTSTRPSTSRARPRHEIDPPHAAAPTASTTTNPPREAPSAGRQPKEDARRLPTAREILSANHAARTDAATTRPRTRRRVRIEPTPTVCREPAHWTIPLWVGWFPATAAALVVGGVGVALAWGWSIESKNAGMIANRLARGGTKVEPIPAWLTPPEPKWWTTTPGHLALWALDRDRTASDPAAVEEVHELLSAAAQASPLQPLVRFALARSGAEAGDATAGRAPSVALSRDVLSLAWTGHQLLASGKKEAALKAYRAALEMAAQADLTRLAPPAFLDDPQVSRFALPAEDLVGPIVRDMAGRGDWTYAEWSRALPPSSVASLAAARVLRERSSPDAEAALDAILARSDAPTLAGAPAAIHLALKAEALALRAQPNWAEAEKLYRQAIDQLPEGVFRRSWWMNLADLALRLNDESNRQKALESAKGRDQNDEIARRAVELLKDYSVRTERN